MIFLYALIAVYIAWIWVDYFRLIDIFESEDLKYVLTTFLLGCASVIPVLGLSQLLSGSAFQLNGNFFNDFLYCTLQIGLVEESAKAIPLIIVYLLFKKQFNEPLDFLLFISVSALGFSATENVMYFNNYGPQLIVSRGILASLGHMFHSSLFAYGIILVKFRNTGYRALVLLLFLFLAALSHGFYDFWLMYDALPGGWLITILYFLVTISIYATILNNALNTSSFFSYKKVVDSVRVSNRMLIYYAVVLLVQVVLVGLNNSFKYTFYHLLSMVFTTGFIIIIAVIRLSRFKLIKDRWQRVRVELPFTFGPSYDATGQPTSGFIGIKGESYNETYINAYYETYFYLYPVSARNTSLDDNQLAYIEKKLFLKNDETFYLAKLFKDESKDTYTNILLKPKTGSTTLFSDKYPIVAILQVTNVPDFENAELDVKSFEFQEWAYLKPVEVQ